MAGRGAAGGGVQLRAGAPQRLRLGAAEGLHRRAANRRLCRLSRTRRSPAGGPATLAFCWAHWRRQFFDLAKSPPAPIAVEALKRIAELYQIEAEIRGKSARERWAARQEKTKPLVAALKTWLETSLARLAGGSTIAQALRYGLNHWEGLVRFLDDGRIEIDSNTLTAACARLPLIERMPYSPAATKGRNTGRCWFR